MVSPEGVVIEGCLIHHALNAADGRTDAHGVVAGAVRNLTIRNTEIHTFSGDGLQVDPGRAAPGWDLVTVERSRIWLAPLPAPENGFAAGAVPGENAIDTKAAATNARSRLIIRDTIASGFRGGLIGNMAAFNLKEHVDAVVDGVTVFDSEIAFRLRGPAHRRRGSLVQNAVVHDVATAFRYEDNIQNLRIWNSTVGAQRHARRSQAASAPNALLDVRNLLSIPPSRPKRAPPPTCASTATAFVNAEAHDYHLAAGSPALNAGERLERRDDRPGRRAAPAGRRLRRRGVPGRALMRNVVMGLVLAAALALAVSPATVAGIDAWKIVLAVVGRVPVRDGGTGPGRLKPALSQPPDLPDLHLFFQHPQPRFGRCRGLYLALDHDVLRAVANPVDLLVGVAVGADGGAGQADSREQSARARVAEDLRLQLVVGGCRRFAADGARGHRRVAADLEGVLRQVVDAALVHDHEHDVGGLTANLEADAAAGERDEGGRRPSRRRLDAHHALAALRADQQRALHGGGNDHDGLRLLDDRFRHALVGRRQHFLEHARGFDDAVGFDLLRERDARQQRQCECRKRQRRPCSSLGILLGDPERITRAGCA